jgi:hypothetical protein
MFKSGKKDAPYMADLERPSRYGYGVPFVLHRLTKTVDSTITSVSLEVSEAGMSAIVRQTLRIGERVEVDIHLPSGDLRVAAIVRGSTGKHYGFQFVELSPSQRQQIASSCKLLKPYTGDVYGS